MDPLTLIFLGPQGSGKGTHIAMVKEYIAAHDARAVVTFSAGSALRAFAEGSGYTQEQVRPLISAGKLVPTFITTSLFAQDLLAHFTGSEHLVFDGFPRTIEQVPDLDSALEFYNRTKVMVVSMVLSDEVATERLIKRGRHDDTKEGILERLRWSREEASSVKQWFQSHPRYRWIDIDGDHSIEDVHKDIMEKLGLTQ